MTSPQLKQIEARALEGKPVAQFLLSQICGQNDDMVGMIHWLKRASDSHFTDAMAALGLCYEKGMGAPRNHSTAIVYYDKAIAANSAVAAYQKAELLYKSNRGPGSNNLISDLLQKSAKAGYLPAIGVIGYFAIQNEKSWEMGIACLRHCADAGDPVSCFNLACCLIQSRFEVGDIEEASKNLKKALTADYPLANELLAELDQSSQKSPAKSPSDPIDFTASYSLYPEKRQLDQKLMNSGPDVFLTAGVLDVMDRAYLIYLAKPRLSRANVIDPGSHSSGMESEVRTSMSTYLPFDSLDFIGRYVELKIICETDQDLVCSEPMSILYYAPGEYYRPHVDYFDPKLKVSKALLEDGGQRTVSAITYLTSPDEGGGTSFQKLDITVDAFAGSTVWFRNCLDDGSPDRRSLHSGDTVVQGEKWVVTKWFRQKPTAYQSR